MKKDFQWITAWILSYERKTWWTFLGNNTQNLPIANINKGKSKYETKRKTWTDVLKDLKEINMPKEKWEMMPTINSLKNTNGQKYMKKYTNSLENKCIKIKAMKKSLFIKHSVRL